MRPRIAFGIQSAVHRADTLDQLVSALGDHRVVVHHDFSQQPDFEVADPRVQFVENPARTGWADWGLILGIQRTIEHCLDHFDFDYFQLLSPVDMPIRPMAEFEAFLVGSQQDFFCDTISLDADEMAFLSFAYRVYALEGSLPYRVLWRLWLAYFGSEPETEGRAGLAIPLTGRTLADGRLAPTARAAAQASRWIVERLRQRDPLLRRYPVHIGGMWFGASRKGCEHLVRQLRDPDFIARFRHYFCAGEMLFNTAVASSGLPSGQGNHAISHYVGARPQWIGVEDLDDLVTSGRFFARKFPDQPDAPVRSRMLERLGLPSQLRSRPSPLPLAEPAPVAEPGDAVPIGAVDAADLEGNGPGHSSATHADPVTSGAYGRA